VEWAGRLDGAFNNVGGGFSSFLPTDQFSDADWNHIISVNTTSAFYCLKYEIQQFKKQYQADPSKSHSYAIVNNSSSLSVSPMASIALYSAAKSALDSLTKSTAIENALNPVIRINSVQPGPTETEILDFLGEGKAVAAKTFGEKPLLKRMAKSEEVARPVVFLLSEWSSYITGTTLLVDGGIVLAK
jgi:NAD(P)-dependent dehydrogenase (short-subunit alcohol dehydrogenase family)